MLYKIITYGCQMNKSDSERIKAVLEKIGYSSVSKESEADLIVVNACSVRQSAIDRIYGKIKEWNKIKKKKPLITMLTGCFLEKDALINKFDFVLKINDLWRLPNLLKEKALNHYSYFQIKPHYTESFRAYLPIMTGCNNFCAYCVVPYTRGREISRTVKEVMQEAEELVKNGCSEITLLGQNVNTYYPEDKKYFSKKNPFQNSFAALLWELNQLKDLSRIHFTAPHPRDMSDEIIIALTLPKQVNYLHLPVQSGSNRILKKMKRNYTKEDYLKLVKKIYKKKPNISLGTDIIVGFPGEREKDFQETVDLYHQIRFDISYNAIYSPRKHTLAFKMKDDLSREEKRKRWNTLQDLMKKIVLEKNQRYLRKIVSVLVDRYDYGYCQGNSLEMKLVKFKGKKNLMGKIVKAEINKAQEWILWGKRI